MVKNTFSAKFQATLLSTGAIQKDIIRICVGDRHVRRHFSQRLADMIGRQARCLIASSKRLARGEMSISERVAQCKTERGGQEVGRGSSTICVCVTMPSRRPCSDVTRVCQTIVRLPR